MKIMWKQVTKPVLLPLFITCCCIFSGCAIMGAMVKPDTWLGILDIVAAGGIIGYIFKSESET
jgi:hypothetical protein